MNETQTRSKTSVLTECAMMVAVSVVLMQIKLFSMPYGGSVTLCSMLPVILISYRNGTKWGLMTGLVLAVLQMITGWNAPPAGTFLAYFSMMPKVPPKTMQAAEGLSSAARTPSSKR